MKWSVVFLGLCAFLCVCEGQSGGSKGLLDEPLPVDPSKPKPSNANPNAEVASSVALDAITTAAPQAEIEEATSARASDTTLTPLTTTRNATTASTTTTASPNSTTTSTTTTTAATTTTTAATTSTSTNAAPNTTTTSTSTTAAPNTTTTTVAPPTTPKPPAPEYQKYVVRDGNKTCIIAQMAAEVVVVSDTERKVLVLPGYRNETDLNGTCGTDEQVLSIGWNVDNETNTIIFTFAKNGTKFHIKEVEIELLLNNETVTLKNEDALFETPVNNSYRCNHEQTVNLTSSSSVVNGSLKVSQVRLEAFHSDGATTKFSSAIDCEPGDVSDIVPIAVGCALAALVVIVLIAYLVGRRRSRTRGYLSM